jgi:hypothetical protein
MNLIPRIGGGALFSWREAHAQRSRNVRKNVDMIARFGCAKAGYEALTITIKAGLGWFARFRRDADDRHTRAWMIGLETSLTGVRGHS